MAKSQGVRPNPPTRTSPPPVQVFGFDDSQPTRHALRFFRERRVAVSYVDLARRAIAAAELRPFVERFGARALVDDTGRAYRDTLVAHLRMDDAELVERLLANNRLLRLPLVRRGRDRVVGRDESGWTRLSKGE
jgi:arsenate reductase-like glutaredoxin family protein